MSNKDSTSYKASNKDKEEEPAHLPATSEQEYNAKPNNERKVLGATPTESNHKDSQHHHSLEEEKDKVAKNNNDNNNQRLLKSKK